MTPEKAQPRADPTVIMNESIVRYAERKHRLDRARIVAQKVMQLDADDAKADEQGAKGGEIVRTVIAEITVGAGIAA
jgi:DNA-directed RNA polymerase subunit H (RpoH/RPB5)